MHASPDSPPIGIAARLGWVSFFNDCSNEVLGRILPLYLTLGLGVTPTFVGVMEGLAECAAIFLKGLSGWLSDRTTSRKGFVLGGYGLSIGARVLYLASLSPLILGFSRVLDRVGKGLRGAPRDAMVADAAKQGQAGRDFGITRFLDTLGAMAGIGLVLALGIGQGPMRESTFRACVYLAIPLGLLALALLLFWVPKVQRSVHVSKRLSLHIPTQIRRYLAIVFVFSLANSSDAFLVLQAQAAGFSFRQILMLFLAFNGLAALLAIPIGKYSDRVGRLKFLAMGWIVYALAYATIGLTRNPAVFATALLGYGAFYGLTEGVEKALLSDLLKPEERGSGFGAFQMITGLAALLASPLMGLMMTFWGAQVAFLASSGLALGAAVGLKWLRPS